MRNDRFVILGLAQVRSPWFGEVARWANNSVIPADFVKCVSVDEVRARLASGRAFSAVLVDGTRVGVDRDLVDGARSVGCAVIIVADDRGGRDWVSLGASAVIHADFGPDELVAALHTHAAVIERADVLPEDIHDHTPETPDGSLIAVTGSGGVGSSTVAMAVAQGLGADSRNRHRVVLADLALDADLAMLHDARDVVPGLSELVEAYRHGNPTAIEVRAQTFDAGERGYHLLLGLRRHRDWTALRPRAFGAALDGLRRTYAHVIADVDADVEGEIETGSVEVEERNLLARSTSSAADVVVVVGESSAKGIHALARTLHRLLGSGIEPRRLLPVVNRAPRTPRRRAELTSALHELLFDPLEARETIASPVFLGERRRLDDVLRDGALLPDQIVDPMVNAVLAALGRVEPRVAPESGPALVAPGSIGSFGDLGEGADS